jgi:hypothetical protein
MGWTKLSEENEGSSGTSGACVAANGADGNVMATGSPIVCTLMNTDGNQASVGSVTTLGVAGWGDNFKGSSRGDAVEHNANLDAMKLLAAIVEGDDEEGEPEEDEFEEDLQADDGAGWAETASDAVDDAEDFAEDGTDAVDNAEDSFDGAVDDATSAFDGAVADATDVVEKVKAFSWAGPSATFQWYQPAEATAYEGLRRYNAGDSVTFFNVELTDDGDAPLPVSEGVVRTLNAATTLIAGAIACGVATLAF